MLTRPIEALEEGDIQRLVDNQVSEGRTIEFKRDLPGDAPEARTKFLAAVTSFANAQGGDLLYGVDAPNGMAAAVPGVEVADVDAATLRLEEKLRAGVAPRLLDRKFRWVRLASGRQVLAIRIQPGLAAPHRVIFKNNGRFHGRGSAGKFEMDVHDLRHAFTESAALPARLQQLHTDAIGRARGNDMPIAMAQHPMAVASVIPLSLFREERDLPIGLEHAVAPVQSADYGGFSGIDMIEGVLLHTAPEEGSLWVSSSALTHRVGYADFAWVIGGRTEIEGRKFKLVHPTNFERNLWDAAHSTEARLRQFGIEGPWIVFVTLFGVADHSMMTGGGFLTKTAYKDPAFLGQFRMDQVTEGALMPIARNFWLLFNQQRPVNRDFGGDN